MRVRHKACHGRTRALSQENSLHTGNNQRLIIATLSKTYRYSLTAPGRDRLQAKLNHGGNVGLASLTPLARG